MYVAHISSPREFLDRSDNSIWSLSATKLVVALVECCEIIQKFLDLRHRFAPISTRVM
jgi:hypothetical protein